VTGPQNSFAPGQVNPALVMGKFTAGKQSNLHARCNIHARAGLLTRSKEF
jgi:hypothetical protein